ncbi:MAG: cobalamin B12-binding domain-containing protein [Deltaproteobacteria bacterium]|nr:cobalamin B12-binding domain-containing protein [Deltaproteobacteria bacterium]
MEIEAFIHALLALDRLRAASILRELADRFTLLEVTEALIIPALSQIGERWARGDISLAEQYMGGRICEDALKPLLSQQGAIRPSQPRLGIVALQDYHLLGKKIVLSCLRSAGFAPRDFGQGASATALVEQVATERIEILFISTLMLPSALAVKSLRSMLDNRQLTTKLVVGGAPFIFDSQLWLEVGADAMGKSAGDVVRILAQLTGESANV